MKIIWVRWHDSTEWHGWQSTPLDDTELVVIETVGYLIAEYWDRIVIAHSISSSSNINGVLAIPKSAIKRRRTIKKR